MISRSRASMTATAAATSRASQAARSCSCRWAALIFIRLVMRAWISTGSQGLPRKSVAPARRASWRRLRWSRLVTITIGTCAKPGTARAAAMTSRPVRPGMS